MSGNVLKVKEQKDRYKVCYMAGDDSGFDMMEGALLVLESLNLPIDWVRESPKLLEKAAELKATCRVSLADAWIAASALLQGATLVHKDPEFETVQCQQLALPYKPLKIHEEHGDYRL